MWNLGRRALGDKLNNKLPLKTEIPRMESDYIRIANFARTFAYQSRIMQTTIQMLTFQVETDSEGHCAVQFRTKGVTKVNYLRLTILISMRYVTNFRVEFRYLCYLEIPQPS